MALPGDMYPVLEIVSLLHFANCNRGYIASLAVASISASYSGLFVLVLEAEVVVLVAVAPGVAAVPLASQMFIALPSAVSDHSK